MLVGALLGCARPPAPALVVRPTPLVEREVGLRTLQTFPQRAGLSIEALPSAVWPRTPGGWRWPVEGVVTSAYGPRWGRAHQGIDIGAPLGTPVVAPRAGVVVRSGSAEALGLFVELEHGDGWTSRYGHLSVIEVETGAALVEAQVLGRVGATGNATGPHLHWELRRGGEPLDPACLMDASACSATGGS